MISAELIIFDMDGLIFDTERLFMDMRADVLEKYGYKHKLEDYIKTLGTAGDNLYNILENIYGKEYPAKKISEESREKVNQWIENNGPPVKKGIRNLFEYLYTENKKLCVATSTESITATAYLEKADLLKYVEFVVGGESVKNSKPSPDIFNLASDKAGIAKEKCLVIEDSENGIIAANNAGIPVICIPDLKYPEEKIKNMTICVVDSAEDLIHNIN